MKKLFPLTVLLLLGLAGCKSQFQRFLEGEYSDAKFYYAMTLFNQGKYTKAAQLFESLSVSTMGTDKGDSVQFFWGMSNYRAKDYVNAQTNFEKYLEHFPRSTFSSVATFYRLDCMYRDTYRWSLDPTPTYQTITALSEYMIANPASEHYGTCQKMLDDLNERLDRKAYEAAYLYYRMEDYKASGVAFHNILKDDPDNVYREKILYYTAMSSYKYASLSVEARKKERFLIFVDDYYNFVGEYPESEYRESLDKIYEKVKQKL